MCSSIVDHLPDKETRKRKPKKTFEIDFSDDVNFDTYFRTTRVRILSAFVIPNTTDPQLSITGIVWCMEIWKTNMNSWLWKLNFTKSEPLRTIACPTVQVSKCSPVSKEVVTLCKMEIKMWRTPWKWHKDDLLNVDTETFCFFWKTICLFEMWCQQNVSKKFGHVTEVTHRVMCTDSSYHHRCWVLNWALITSRMVPAAA